MNSTVFGNSSGNLLARLTSAVSLLSLVACATSTGVVNRFPGNNAEPPPEPIRIAASGPGSVPEAEAALNRGDAISAARLYQSAAVDSTPTQAAEYRLRAADAANAGNDPILADEILDRIPALPLDARQTTRYRILRAQTALGRNDPARALRLLPPNDPGGEPSLAQQQLLLRAQAQARSNDPIGATQSLVLRERYLAGIVALSSNRDTLWTLLQGATLDNAILSRANSIPMTARGWLELAALAKRNAALGEFEAWRQRYPRHPGEERLAALYIQRDANPTLGTTLGPTPGPTGLGGGRTAIPIFPGNAGNYSGLAPQARGGSAALLLPQSGPLAMLADALKSGYNSAATAAGSPGARVYESSAFAQAVNDGSGVIVGPLRKEDIALLTQASAALLVPVLALNYLDANKPAPPGLYQFGLAPEDEARAAAEDAVSRGFTRALSMVPSTDWGNRVQAAFEARLRELGGQLVEGGRYSGEPQNWSDPVKKLLRYVAIDDRKDAAAARAKVGPDVDPQRRNDFDFVFIAGRASQARVLWPLFRYYHADRKPVYATSAVNEGRGDSDLSGIRFCDTPWLLDTGGALGPLHDEALNGRSREAARFYAFGADAYLLASRLGQNALHPGDELNGATGLLKVDAGGAVRRRLVCARMTNGGDPFVLPASAEPPPLP